MPRAPLARIPEASDTNVESRSWWRRGLWFIGLWLASVGVLGAVALLIRFWIKP